MMRELRTRVTLATAATTAVLAGLALGMGGPTAGLGVAAAAGLMLANFWWLVRNAGAVAVVGPAQRSSVWAVAAGARFLALLGVVVALLASRTVHPVAFVVGLTVVPGAVIVVGLLAGRRAGAC